MTDELPPELQRIVAAERSRPGAPGDAKDIARARLATLLGPAAGLGSTSQPGGPPVAHGARGTGTAGAASSAAGAVSTGAVGLAKLAGAFVLGGTMTAGALTVARAPNPPRPVAQLAQVAQVASGDSSAAAPPVLLPDPAWTAIPAAPSLTASAISATPSAPSTPSATSHPSSVTTSDHADHDLASERILLERARSALARGDGSQALAALDQHARSYKTGQLAEEREALSIQALLAVDRQDEATGRAARFRAAYPHSVFLPMIDEMLR
jgi:hypothetical protein